MSIITTNPATGELIKRYETMSSREMTRIIEKANAAQQTWRRTGFDERSTVLTNLAKRLRDEREALA
jgi:succinate-semialdehyde dehydrogenase/glutarate-semialdehyde dehydrogenase